MAIPTLEFQQAVRSALLGNPTIRAYVAPEHIRQAAFRPDQLPAIHLSPSRTEILGHASGCQIVAEVRAMVHVWAHQDGSGTAESIAAAACRALMDRPASDGFGFDSWERPALVWMNESDDMTHAAISLSGVIRWRDAQ